MAGKKPKKIWELKASLTLPAELAKAMTELYESYVKEMELDKIWNPEMEIGANFQTKKEYKIAYIESEKMANYFETFFRLQKRSS